MDIIGVGSLPIVLLIGFFTGVVITMQMARALAQYGAVDQVGPIVAITLVRELGPVLTAVLVAGRNASGIASELGSMKVTEQIDAMRALGTDPIRKLVAPRILALLVTLPLLTLISDVMGIVGGWAVSTFLYGLPSSMFLNSVRDGITTDDLLGGIIKPLFFAFLMGTIACHKGLKTEGGTVGVGRATTSAVVMASIIVIIADFILARALQLILGTQT